MPTPEAGSSGSSLLSALGPTGLVAFSGLILMILYLPFDVEFVVWSNGRRHVFFHYFDFPLLLLVIMSPFFAIKRRPWKGNIVGLLLLGLTLLYGISLAVHPNVRGAQLSYRILAILALATIIRSIISAESMKVVLAAVVGIGSVQGALAVAQIAAGDTIGLSILGERGALWFFGETPAAVGTFDHPYRLAGFAAVTTAAAMLLATEVENRARQVTLLGLVLCAAPLGLTTSRMAFLAVALASIVLLVAAVRRKPGYAALLLVFVGTVSVCAAMTAAGWEQRAAQSTSTSSSVDEVTSGRVTLTKQALRMIAAEPWIGVGPANYMSALTAAEGDDAVMHVHNFPLIVAAEAGAPAGLLVLSLLGVLAASATRKGAAYVALFVLFLPFLMLEAFPYMTSQGLALVALWIGILSGFRSNPRPQTEAAS